MCPVDPIEVYSPHCSCSNHANISYDDKRMSLNQRVRAETPYPMFCRHPLICAGKGSCPNDPCCAD